MSGEFKVDGSGNVQLKEADGLDYAPVTVQLPGGERVPFLFSIKELDAKVRSHPGLRHSRSLAEEAQAFLRLPSATRAPRTCRWWCRLMVPAPLCPASPAAGQR